MTTQLINVWFSAGLPLSEFYTSQIRDNLNIPEEQDSFWYVGTLSGVSELLIRSCGIDDREVCDCGCHEQFIQVDGDWDVETTLDEGDEWLTEEVVIIGA